MQLVNTNDFNTETTHSPSTIPKARFQVVSHSPNYVRIMLYDATTDQIIATVGQQMIKDFMAKLITNQKGVDGNEEVHQSFPYNELSSLDQCPYLLGHSDARGVLVKLVFAFAFPDNSTTMVSTPNFYLSTATTTTAAAESQK